MYRVASWLVIAFLVLTLGGCGAIGMATVADARYWVYSVLWLVVLLPAGLLCLAGAGVLWFLARLRTHDRQQRREVAEQERTSAGSEPTGQTNC